MKKNLALLVACMCIGIGVNVTACKVMQTVNSTSTYPSFFKIGHRGARGLMPENTIPAMKKAIDVGANMIEVDVHITKNGKVVVYHDDSFDPNYTLMPDGSEIPEIDRKKYTFYQMDYKEIKPFLIGTKKYLQFPDQQRLASYTPELVELIDSVEDYSKSINLPAVYYLIEIKSNPSTDGFAQPSPEEYVKILMNVVNPKKLGKRLIIQSFDMRPLKILHRDYPKVALGYLTGDHKIGFEENITKLGFNPTFYNPQQGLVNASLIKACHDRDILIAPWTVQTISEMKAMKALGVDGIITDYPNLLKEL